MASGTQESLVNEQQSADYVVEPNGYDEWIEGTRVIRQWVGGDTISTEALVAELRYWADYFEVRQEQDRHHA